MGTTLLLFRAMIGYQVWQPIRGEAAFGNIMSSYFFLIKKNIFHKTKSMALTSGGQSCMEVSDK